MLAQTSLPSSMRQGHFSAPAPEPESDAHCPQGQGLTLSLSDLSQFLLLTPCAFDHVRLLLNLFLFSVRHSKFLLALITLDSIMMSQQKKYPLYIWHSFRHFFALITLSYHSTALVIPGQMMKDANCLMPAYSQSKMH